MSTIGRACPREIYHWLGRSPRGLPLAEPVPRPCAELGHGGRRGRLAHAHGTTHGAEGVLLRV